MSMFCYQCEQTAGGTGCTKLGVCGKDEEVAALQDLLIHAVKQISVYAAAARTAGKSDAAVDAFIEEAIFATVTNVDFDTKRFVEYINQAREVKATAKAMCDAVSVTAAELAPEIPCCASQEDLIAMGVQVGILNDHPNEDIRALRQLIIYGIKGIASYAYHTRALGKADERVATFMPATLVAITNPDNTVDELVGLALKTGEANLWVMESLDAGHVEKFGTPEPAPVFLGTKAGPGILVSGHDMLDLLTLLEQTAGTGINIYTHGEMLPAYMYPALKKFPHLVANYGTAWQNQQREFEAFPGPIVMTTNCLMKPRDTYKDRVYTIGPVGWPGMKHLGHSRDFSAVIAQAKALPALEETDGQTILTGFHHLPVLAIADKVIDAVKSGAVKHFFLVGGCDGAKPGRNYYTEFVEQTPDDTIILTLACGKYRFNTLELGDIGGIPRLLDMGQCNNAYSAIQVAVALAGAFECGVNDLPLSMILSWYEQKACAILLTLLFLDIKNIRIGPSLPAFVTPPVLDVLVKNFNLTPITTPEADIAACLA